MTPTRVKAEVLRALLSYYELRDVIVAGFAKTDQPKDVVRCSEVAAFAAAKVSAENSPQFRRRVRHAAALGGWTRVIKRGHVAMYREMVRRPRV